MTTRWRGCTAFSRRCQYIKKSIYKYEDDEIAHLSSTISDNEPTLIGDPLRSSTCARDAHDNVKQETHSPEIIHRSFLDAHFGAVLLVPFLLWLEPLLVRHILLLKE